MRHAKIKGISPLALFIFSLLNYPIYADPIDHIKAKAPYIIKPHTPTIAPTGLVPSTVRSVYGFDQIANQGEGKTIAIIDAFDHPNIEQDLAVFSSIFNLPPCTTANGCFKKVYATGTQPAGDTGWGVEIALDVQWAHAIAPKATIILVEAEDDYLSSLYQAITVATTYKPDVLSMSWGSLEYSGQVNYDSMFNVPGIEFVACSMDSGHGVWYPASSPYVIGVGGTTLKSNSGNYSEVAWSGSGGGISAYEAAPASQSNFPLPNNPNKMRGVPDVAYIGDPASGFSIYDTYGYGGWMVIGGTSAGAPQWAALIAIAKSATSAKLIGMQSMLYTIAKNNYNGTFNDITSGSNGSCGYLCTAQTGYDYVTGIGTPKASALIPALIGQGQMSVTVNPATVTLQTGQTQQFTATVTGNSNTSVTWSASGGSIANTGLYTAPMTVGNYQVKATSVADSTKYGTASVSVVSGPPTGSNLALNQPTIASSEYSAAANSATMATDNDPINTQWSAYDASNGNWLLIDLGTLSNLTGTQVKWGSKNSWKYKIEVSPDESSWTLVKDQTNNTTSAQTYADNFQVAGRYVRITSTLNPVNQRAAIYDFEAFGTHAVPPPSNNPINLAINKPTTASSQFSSTYAPSMSTDSDTMQTRWCANNGSNGQWVMVDLGAAATIAKTRIKWESYGVWQYKVETSLDGASWTLLIDKTANTVSSQTYEDLATGKARYVRVTATTNQSGHWASLYDFEVFGNMI